METNGSDCTLGFWMMSEKRIEVVIANPHFLDENYSILCWVLRITTPCI